MQETKFTTCYEDVFGLVTVEEQSDNIEVEEQGIDGDLSIDEKEEGIEVENSKIYSLHSGREENHTSGIYKRVFNFPQIDNLSDSFRDKTQFIVVWLAVSFHSSYLTVPSSAI